MKVDVNWYVWLQDEFEFYFHLFDVCGDPVPGEHLSHKDVQLQLS